MVSNHLDIPTGIVTAYHLKTLMLWEVETKPKEFYSQKYLCNCILVILQDLIHAVVLKELLHYFIDIFNLFATTDSCHLNQVAIQLNWLRSNPHLIIPDKQNMKIRVDQTDCNEWIINGNKLIKIPVTNADHYWNACSMSETAANLAALTLYQHILGKISTQHMRKREILLNAFLLVVQKICTSVQLLEENNNREEINEEDILGASKLTQTMKTSGLLELAKRQLNQGKLFNI